MPGPVRALTRLRAVARITAPATDEVARLGKVDRPGTVDLSGTTNADTSPDSLPIRPNARPLLNGLLRAFALGPESRSQDEFTILGIESQIDSG